VVERLRGEERLGSRSGSAAADSPKGERQIAGVEHQDGIRVRGVTQAGVARLLQNAEREQLGRSPVRAVGNFAKIGALHAACACSNGYSTAGIGTHRQTKFAEDSALGACVEGAALAGLHGRGRLAVEALD